MTVKDKLLAVLDKKSNADEGLVQIMSHRYRDFDPKGLKGRKLREAVAEHVTCYYEKVKAQELDLIFSYEIPEISGHGTSSKIYTLR